ncbi:MAG TPA: riboflavin synthase [Puia sp.]|nr:riboflavin synthase [Puia sp.]
MFTGIIESLGTIDSIETHGTNKTFWVSSPVSGELQIDQSISHNGVCLTVEEVYVPGTRSEEKITRSGQNGLRPQPSAELRSSLGSVGPDGRAAGGGSGTGLHRVTAIRETLEKTNLDHWKPGGLVNLERCLQMNGRLDGHIVQGHVDATATCTDRKELDGSWEFRFEFPKKFSHLVIEKGSISLNGISLTIFNVKRSRFDIAVIPYTYEHTNIQSIKTGDRVNLEFDMIGKYVSRMMK